MVQKSIIVGVLLTLLSVSIFSSLNIMPTEAIGTIYIKADGSIDDRDRSIAPISSQARQRIEIGNYSFVSSTTKVGDTFTAEIRISDWVSPPIFAYQISVQYYSHHLEAVSAEIPENHFLKPVDPKNLFVVDAGTIDQWIDRGWVSFSATLLRSEVGKVGNGIIGTIEFKILQAPDPGHTISSIIGFREVILVDLDANVFQPSTYDVVYGFFTYTYMSDKQFYQNIVEALPAQMSAFTDSTAGSGFAGGTTFACVYDPATNVLSTSAPDFLMETNYETSRISLSTSVIQAAGFMIHELGEMTPGEDYLWREYGLGVNKHEGKETGSQESFDGYSVSIPVFGGGFKVATGDQGTISASATTPGSNILGIYVSASEGPNGDKVVGGLKAGAGIVDGLRAGASGGLGGYWKEDEWGLVLNVDAEADFLFARFGYDGSRPINLKPIADGVVAAGDYIVRGGKYVADKVGNAIEDVKDTAKTFTTGVKNWWDSIHSPVPPMPEDVNATLETICNEFTFELYQILVTTPVTASNQAVNLILPLQNRTTDQDIKNRIILALDMIESASSYFEGTWNVKSISLFDNMTDAIGLINETITIAEQVKPEIVYELVAVRENLTDAMGLLAGDVCYDAKVAGGLQEFISLADEAFAQGDYKAAYTYALMSNYTQRRADLNKDGIVNILDITVVAIGYNSRLGDSNWNLTVDLDKNGAVNILDISMVAKDYGKTI